jgi:hypothetical protein
MMAKSPAKFFKTEHADVICETRSIPLTQYRMVNNLAAKEHSTTEDILRRAIGQTIQIIKEGAVTLGDIAKDAGTSDDDDKILETLYLPSEHEQTLKSWASEANISMDDIMRLALANYLKTQF